VLAGEERDEVRGGVDGPTVDLLHAKTIPAGSATLAVTTPRDTHEPRPG
jgi:hypothetical protein